MSKLVFICGSALSGQPDHGNLKGSEFLGAVRTDKKYRLHSVQDGWHPGIYAVDNGGISISGELYRLTDEQFEHLLSTEPPNMYPADISLQDHQIVTAMLYPKNLIDERCWPDISEFGGWAAYKNTVA